LLRRRTEPLGVIDVRAPRERQARANALLRRHVSPVRHLIVRSGEEAPPAPASGLVLVNPPADQRLESHSAGSPGPVAPVRTADPAPVTQRAVVTNSPARSGDHEQVAPIPLQRVARPSIDHVRADGAIATIQRAAAVATPPSPLPLSAGIPFFMPAAAPAALGDSVDGVSRGDNQSTATDATPIDREPTQDAALRLAPGRRQPPDASKAGGDRRGRSRSLDAPPSRSDDLPILRTRVIAAKPNDVPVRRPSDAPAAAAIAEAPPVNLALSRSTTTMVQHVARVAADTTARGHVPSTAAVRATTEAPSPAAIAEPPMTLTHHVQRAPVAATVASTERSMPSVAPLPLHSVNTGRITAAIARTATANTTASQTTTIARASSEPVAVTAIAPSVTSSDRDREPTGGGGALGADRMMSHMLKQIAIERERRGGGRWP
jgi:hypothetical protein